MIDMAVADMTTNGARRKIPLLPEIRSALFKASHPFKERFECPICRYQGPFRDVSPATGKRLHARCPYCGALERHRLQSLVLDTILPALDTRSMRMLHFAPESFFQARFLATFGKYETADISMPGVDHQVDLQALPFDSGSYDIVYASHVLEHIPDDNAAIAEIRRVLAPDGLAILPVPLVSPITIEYQEPNPNESMHVRAPGPDYYDRYRLHFDRVTFHSSDDFPPEYQLFAYEERKTSQPELQSRQTLAGSKHLDVVPVCFA